MNITVINGTEKYGVTYHREGIYGDYDDFADLEELIEFIKTGER